VRVVQDAEVVQLGGIGEAHLTRLHLELRLAQTSSLNKDIVYANVSVGMHNSRCGDVRCGARTSASIGFRGSGSLRSSAISSLSLDPAGFLYNKITYARRPFNACPARCARDRKRGGGASQHVTSSRLRASGGKARADGCAVVLLMLPRQQVDGKSRARYCGGHGYTLR